MSPIDVAIPTGGAAGVEIVDPTLPVAEPPDPRGLGGLVALADGAERPLPLRSVRVRAAIAGDACRTVVEQRFANSLDVPLEAVHIFPLPPAGAVVEMELVAGDTRVRAECRERAAAEAAFEAARSAGHRAGLLTEERADVHTLRVTNLPPGTDVTVRLVVVERLESVDGRFHWRFPTVIAPRYLPGEPIGHAGPGVHPDSDRAPDASRLQPPLRLAGGTLLDLEVEIAGPVAAVETSLHAARVSLGGGGMADRGVRAMADRGDGAREGSGSSSPPGAGGVRVAPSGRATLDRDFVVAFSTGAPDAAAARAWTDGAFTLVVVVPPLDAPIATLPRDAVFVVDVSGSMGGVKIEAARAALATAVHGLAAGDRFNMLAFNNTFTRFRPDLVEFSQASLDAADAWVRALAASGGTEMLAPIQAALEGETPEGRLRTVLFITDGQAWNETELVAAVAHRRGAARFFTLGIDTAVNSALLARLARVGGGTCELLAPSDDIEGAVARLEARFGSPVATGVRVESGGATDGSVAAASDAPVTLFAGRPASLLVEGAPERVTVTGRSAAGPVTWSAVNRRIDLPLGALWARDRVAALEDRMALHPHEAEGLRAEIIRVALAHAVASRFTAFVAVDTSVTATGERVEVVQPVELPHGWDPAFLEAPAGAPAIALGARSINASFRRLSRPMTRDAGAAYSPNRPMADLAAFDLADAAPVVGGRPSAPPGRRPAEGPAPASPTRNAELAASQMADGSIAGDVGQTAALLVLLALSGHTRRSGSRRRMVAKAAAWLEARAGDPTAELALDVLRRVESGEAAAAIVADLGDRLAALATLTESGVAGSGLRDLMEQARSSQS